VVLVFSTTYRGHQKDSSHQPNFNCGDTLTNLQQTHGQTPCHASRNESMMSDTQKF
jgi:hypothetical protein